MKLTALLLLTHGVNLALCNCVTAGNGDYVYSIDDEWSNFVLSLVETGENNIYNSANEALGKCVGEHFRPHYQDGEQGTAASNRIVRILSESEVSAHVSFLNLVAAGDLQGVLKHLTKVDIDMPDFSNCGALIQAMVNGHTDIARVLLVHGASPDSRQGVNGPTALMLAASLNDMRLVELLLEKGADIDGIVKNPSLPTCGYTALHMAARRMSVGTVEILMRRGIDSHVRGCDGKDVIDVMRATLVTGSTALPANKREKQHRAYAEMAYIIEGVRNEVEGDHQDTVKEL